MPSEEALKLKVRTYRLVGDGAAEIEAAAQEIATDAVVEFARILGDEFDASGWREVIRRARERFEAKQCGTRDPWKPQGRDPREQPCGCPEPCHYGDGYIP